MPTIPIFAEKKPQHEVIRRRDDFKEDKRLFKEMISLEKALLQQLSKAIPEMYLKRFRNKDSNAINKPISFILSHLFLNYGRVPEEHLREEEAKLLARVFDLTQLLILMFNKIDDLVDLAIAAKLPYTEHQIVNLGLTLVKNTNDFEKGISDWIEKKTTKDWDAFKMHFETTQENLQKMRGPTMRSNALMRQANVMREEQEQYVNTISAAEHRIMNALESHTLSLTSENDSSSENSSHLTPLTPSVNVTTSDAMMAEVLKLLKDIKDNCKQPHNSCKRNKDSRNNNSRKNDQSSDGKQRSYLTQDQKKKRSEESYGQHSKYCHTHGACTHTNNICKYPKQGHKKEATFKDMMGSSKAYCQNCDRENGAESRSSVTIKQNLTQLSLAPLIKPKIVIAKADSGASNNYWRPQDTHCLKNIKKYLGPSVILPDTETLSPSQQGTVLISKFLSQEAQKVTVLLHLCSSSLISLGNFFDSDCTIVMNNKNYMLQNQKI